MKQNQKIDFSELDDSILSSEPDTEFILKFGYNKKTGIYIKSFFKVNTKFLTNIGSYGECPLGKEYEEKFVNAFGRLARKGKKNV